MFEPWDGISGVMESFPIEEIILIIDWNFYSYNVLMVPTYQHGLTLIPEWISNYIHY